jgi:SprT protein
MTPLFEETKLTVVEELANELLEEHDLSDWRFEWSKDKRTVGWCRHHRKVIQYSLYFVHKTDMDEIRDTLLHEIAHALVGANHGHNHVWKSKCREIGARPERLANEESKTTAVYNYKLLCDNCGKEYYRYRLRRATLYCSRCDSTEPLRKFRRKQV